HNEICHLRTRHSKSILAGVFSNAGWIFISYLFGWRIENESLSNNVISSRSFYLAKQRFMHLLAWSWTDNSYLMSFRITRIYHSPYNRSKLLKIHGRTIRNKGVTILYFGRVVCP